MAFLFLIGLSILFCKVGIISHLFHVAIVLGGHAWGPNGVNALTVGSQSTPTEDCDAALSPSPPRTEFSTRGWSPWMPFLYNESLWLL